METISIFEIFIKGDKILLREIDIKMRIIYILKNLIFHKFKNFKYSFSFFFINFFKIKKIIIFFINLKFIKFIHIVTNITYI